MPSLCAAFAALLFAGAALPAGVAGANRFGDIARIVGLRNLGRVAAAAPVPLAVRLAYHHSAELEALARAPGDPASRSYRHFLTRLQIRPLFRADAERPKPRRRRATFERHCRNSVRGFANRWSVKRSFQE